MLTIPGKIPIVISPLFWGLALLIGWMNTATIPGTLIWTMIILGSVLIHEYGHALTALAFGQQARIELVALGGVTKREGDSRKLWKEFLITLNGPLAGLCLSGIAWIGYQLLLKAHPASLLTYVAMVTFYVNLFWTILNLLPVQPLDGGKLLSIVLESIFGLKGTKIARFISFLLAASMGVLFLIMQEFFIGALFLLFSFENYKSWKESLAISNDDQNPALQELLDKAHLDLQHHNKPAALDKLLSIRGMSKAGMIHQTATENAAHLLAEEGFARPAYDMLAELGKKISPEGLILQHQLAYGLAYWKEAVSLGDRVYLNTPNYQVAMMNAASHATLGNVKPAVGWIQTAIHDGLPDLHEALEHHAFDRIRNDPLFRRLSE